MRPPHTLLRRD